MAPGSANLAIARRYLEAIERGATADDPSAFFTGPGLLRPLVSRPH